MNSLRPRVDFGPNKALKGNYAKSLMDVYRDFARIAIQNSPRRLEVLSHMRKGKTHVQHNGFLGHRNGSNLDLDHFMEDREYSLQASVMAIQVFCKSVR